MQSVYITFESSVCTFTVAENVGRQKVVNVIGQSVGRQLIKRSPACYRFNTSWMRDVFTIPIR